MGVDRLGQVRRAKEHVWARLKKQKAEVAPSQWRGVAAHMREELLSVGVSEETVHFVVQGLVNDAEWKKTLNWKIVVLAHGQLLEHLLERHHKLSSAERSHVAADLRQKLIAAGVPEDRVDHFMRHWLPSAQAEVISNATVVLAAADNSAGEEEDSPFSSPGFIAAIVLGVSVIVCAGVCLWLRSRNSVLSQAPTAGDAEAQTLGKDQPSKDVGDGSESLAGASTVAPSDAPSADCEVGC